MAEMFISHSSTDRSGAEKVAAALRDQGHTYFLDADRDDGIVPGSVWSHTLFHKLRICDALIFLNSRAAQSSMWCHTELAVAADLGKQAYWLDLEPGMTPHPLVQSVHGIPFGGSIDEGIAELMRALSRSGLIEQRSLRWDDRRPPYPGLAAMDVDDAGVYFGRERDVTKLVERVSGRLGQLDGDLVAVVGPSGAGKSSLVRAGLAARLMSEQSGWVVVEPFEPGPNPMGRLVTRLARLRLGNLIEEDVQQRLAASGLRALADWIVEHRDPPAKRLLIVIDQAEQLASAALLAERDHFLTVLADGLGHGSPLTVVLTVRSDRFDEAQRLPLVGTMINEPFVVAPMDRNQLAAVIEGPARRADIEFEAGLIGRLIDDAMRGSTGETVDALPLLAFALREMYNLAVHSGRRKITESDYESVGRIEGAIARHARVAESALPPESRSVLEELLPRFVSLSDERLPTGRTVLRKQLTPTEEAVVEQLEDQRLLTGTGETVRLAHEQLITAWPTLAETLIARRDDLLLEGRLERQATDWKSDAGALLSPDATRAAGDWLVRQRQHSPVDPTISEYVRSSKRTLRRRRVVSVVVLSLIVLLAAVAAVVAGYTIHRNAQLRAQTESQDVAAEAQNLMESNIALASKLSVEALSLSPTTAARNAVLRSLQTPLDALVPAGSTVNAVSYDPVGTSLAVGTNTRGLLLLDPSTRAWHVLRHDHNEIDNVAFSPNGQTVAAGDSKGNIFLVNASTGASGPALENSGSAIDALAFNHLGTQLAVGDEDGDIYLYNTLTGVRGKRGDTDGSSIDTVTFSPDGTKLMVGDFDGDLRMFNLLNTAPVPQFYLSSSPIDTLAFSPDGKTIAVGDREGDIAFFNSALGTRITENEGGGNNEINSMVFSKDGSNLFVGYEDGVEEVDPSNGDVFTGYSGDGSQVWSVSLSANGELAAGSDAGNVLLFGDIAASRPREISLDGATVHALAFNPTGSVLAVGDYSGEVSFYDAQTDRLEHRLSISSQSINSLAYSRNGKVLAIGDSSGGVTLYNVTAQRAQKLVSFHDTAVYSVAFAPLGNVVAVGTGNGKVSLLHLSSASSDQVLHTGKAPVYSVAFNVAGNTLAAGTGNGKTALFAIPSGTPRGSLRGDGSWISTLAFDPNSNTLAASDGAGNVQLSDATSSAQLNSLTGDGNAIEGMAISNNGHVLATGDTEGEISFWDLATHSSLGEIDVEGDPIYSVAFSTTGAAAAADNRGEILVVPPLFWQGGLPALSKDVCSRIPGNPSREQWSQYVAGVSYRLLCPTAH